MILVSIHKLCPFGKVCLYPYMLWATSGNQETNVILIADRQTTLVGLYPYMLRTTPGNQETNVMFIADKHWLGSTPTCCGPHQGIRRPMSCS